MEPKELAIRIATILDSKKAESVRMLKVHDLTILTDYFVIATGNSTTHVSALVDEVEFQLGQQGIKPTRVEGADSKRWILADYSSVLLHVFTPDARDFYDLDHLWADAEPVDITPYLDAAEKA